MMSFTRTISSLLSALCIVFATASHAFANNGPGPLAFFSLFTLVLLIVALTFAGGGYSVAKRLADAKYPSRGKRSIMNALEFIAGVVLFFVGIFASIIGVVGFSLYAIGRGVRMIRWSRATEKEGARPAHLEGANPKRLKIAGVTLIVLTVVVLVYSILNVGDVVGINPDWRKKGYVAALTSEARTAHKYAKAYLLGNTKAGVVTCADMEKAGYKPSRRDVTCFSDMTATSGSIRITGPDQWNLKKPVAVITYSGELAPAEP